MNPDTLKALLTRVTHLERGSVNCRTGRVTATAPLSIALGGSSVAYTNVRTLRPGLAINDLVSVLVFGNDLIVLGKIGNTATEAWHEVGAPGEPVFQNSWVNYGSPWATAAFYKDPSGLVHIRGLIKSGLDNSACFTLPVGYRPPFYELFSTDTNTNAHARLDIAQDGSVAPRGSTVGYLSLSGITFKAI